MFWNLFLSWLAFSNQLESTIFNSSLALCLFLMGESYPFEYFTLNKYSRSVRSSLLFHNCGCLISRGRLRREIVLVPSAGPPKEPGQHRLLPDLLLQLRVESGPHKVRWQGSSRRGQAKRPTFGTLVLDHLRHIPQHFLLQLSSSEDIFRNFSTNKCGQGLYWSKVVQCKKCSKVDPKIR